jgi:hypothetical protein
VVDLHGVLGLDPPTLGHESVDLLDAALGVLAVAAHVPFAYRATGAGHGVGAADDADHEIALPKRAARARVDHPAQGFVPEHEARLALRSPAVLALHDLDVGPAYADGDGFHEDRPGARSGSGMSSRRAVSGWRGSTVIAFISSAPAGALPKCLGYFAALAPFTRIVIA